MINTSITPISYKDASKLLGKSPNHIAVSVSYKIFSRLPTIGLEQRLIKEQIELFIGKKQIRLSMLSSDEIKLWEHYRDIAENYNTHTVETTMYSQDTVAELLAATAHKITSMTEEEKKRLLTISLLAIVGIIGISWLIKHRDEIAEKLREELGETIDIDNVIDSVLKEIA